MFLFEAKASRRGPTAYTATVLTDRLAKEACEVHPKAQLSPEWAYLCVFSLVHCGKMCLLLAGVPMTCVGEVLKDTLWSTIYKEGSLALDRLTINRELADLCSCSLLLPLQVTPQTWC